MDDSETTLTYQGILSAWGPTTVVEVDQELMLVSEVDTTSKVATVIRGWLNTTPAAHVANSVIFLNPRMMRSDVLDLINDCLDDLFGHDLYATDVEALVYNSSTIGYDLDASLVKVLRVDGLTDTYSKLWEPIYDWHMMDNADVADFASTKALMLRAALPFGSEMRVIYSKPFTRITTEADDLEAVAGLRPYMVDLPFYFALNRLMVEYESRRSQMEGAVNHQRAQDTPAFLSLRTGEWYQARYLDRINTARAHLRKETLVPLGTGYGS